MPGRQPRVRAADRCRQRRRGHRRRPRRTPAANGTPETTVYKSGVIDGMAYTLFMDGSIEAELPQGKVRFASVDELQKYLTTRA